MDVAIPVSATKFAAALSLITALLVAASLGASYLSFVPIEGHFLREARESIVRLLWVDGEGNIPTWYSASLLLTCSVLLAVIATAHRQHRAGNVVGWLILSLIFGFLSLDETAQLHELSIAPLQDVFHATGFLHYTWIVPAGVCVVLFVLGYLKFLMQLPRRTRRLFVLAGAIFVGGAIGVEAISGKQASLHGEQNSTYNLIITVEELFEMAGVIVFIYALLDYISRQFTKLAFQFTSR